MGNRESVTAAATGSSFSCSADDPDEYLASSTDSTSLSGYRGGGFRARSFSYRSSSGSAVAPTSAAAAAKKSPPIVAIEQRQKQPASPPPLAAGGGDLCSVLNHHHDSVFEPAPQSCACRRSLSTGGGGGASVPPERPRILPIVRNGRQLSDDFYWVLPQRKKHLLEQQSRMSLSSSSDHSCCEPLSFYGPGCTPLDLVRRVTGAVFGVTDEESYLSLSLHHWDTEKAIRYLKVEQLFRSGICDRERCVKLLEMNSWRLDSVIQQVNNRQRLCRSDSN